MSDPVNPESLLVWYASPDALREAWLRDLALGALFVETANTYEAGERVRVVIELPFCEGSVDIEGKVVGSIPTDMASTGATPGIAVQTDLPALALRERIEELAGLSLPDEVDHEDSDADREPRFLAEAPVVIEMDGRHYNAKTVDISYNGTLVLLPGIDLGEGSALKVVLSHPRRDERLEIAANVARQTRCDHGVMAIGIRFAYAFDEVDKVSQFIDDLRGFDRARKLTTVTGSLAHTLLESVLETFTSVSSEGTLRLICGGDEGKIAYRDAEIVSAVTGLVVGAKALGRMFSWTDGQFEFVSEIEIDGQENAIPLDSATVTAAIERDELGRLPIDILAKAESLLVDEARFCELKSELSEMQREVAENAGMGFPPGALLDILPATDAAIYRAMVELIDVGVLSVA